MDLRLLLPFSVAGIALIDAIRVQTPLTSAGASDKALPLTVYFHPRNSQSDSNSASFDPALFFKHLRSRGLGHLLLSAAVLPSTQTLLQQNSRTLPDGTVCVADQQAAGKGTIRPAVQLPAAIQRLHHSRCESVTRSRRQPVDVTLGVSDVQLSQSRSSLWCGTM